MSRFAAPSLSRHQIKALADLGDRLVCITKTGRKNLAFGGEDIFVRIAGQGTMAMDTLGGLWTPTPQQISAHWADKPAEFHPKREALQSAANR